MVTPISHTPAVLHWFKHMYSHCCLTVKGLWASCHRYLIHPGWMYCMWLDHKMQLQTFTLFHLLERGNNRYLKKWIYSQVTILSQKRLLHCNHHILSFNHCDRATITVSRRLAVKMALLDVHWKGCRLLSLSLNNSCSPHISRAAALRYASATASFME